MNILNNNRTPIVTYSIIVLCVLAYIPVALNLLPKPDPFALYLPENPNFHYWQYLTSMFMHAGILHLLFNMFGLWMFGTPLEKLWGGAKFLAFYLICGIGAGLIYNWINEYQFQQMTQEFMKLGLTSADLSRLLNEMLYPTNIPGFTEKMAGDYYSLYHTETVGASGAIYGVLVAFAYYFPNSKLALIFFPVPIPAKYFVPILIGIDLFSGVTGVSIFGGNVANFAHVSGALVGLILVLLFGRDYKRDAPNYN